MMKLAVPPWIHPFSFGDEPLTAGQQATLQCIVEGDLPLNINWVIHGHELSSQMGVDTVRIGKRINLLTIDSVAAFHVGNYTCAASNPHFNYSSNFTAELKVRG